MIAARLLGVVERVQALATHCSCGRPLFIAVIRCVQEDFATGRRLRGVFQQRLTCDHAPRYASGDEAGRAQ